MIVRLKMPFRFAGLIREKEVPFLFKIMTLEMVCEQLGIDIDELDEKSKVSNYDLSLSIVWNGYLAACKEIYKKPRYKFSHAVIWHEYMSQETRDLYIREIQELTGKVTEKKGKSKAVKKKSASANSGPLLSES